MLNQLSVLIVVRSTAGCVEGLHCYAFILGAMLADRQPDARGLGGRLLRLALLRLHPLALLSPPSLVFVISEAGVNGGDVRRAE